MRNIIVRDACENNLKHVDCDIPKEKLVVFAGVSGSGKSSLVFDTVAAESCRQWQNTYPVFIRNRLPHYEHPSVGRTDGLTPCVVVDQKPLGANVRSTVGTASDIAPLLRLLFSRAGKPSAGGSMAYSFNHPMGMCPDCTGLGERVALDEEAMFDMDRTINEGAIRFSQFSGGSWQEFYYHHNPLYPADKPLKDFTEEEWKALRTGPDEPLIMEHGYNNTGQASKLPYEGIVPRFNRLYLNRDISGLRKEVREEAERFMKKSPCITCGGSGLNPKALESRINGYNIMDMNEMQVCDLLSVLSGISDPVGSSIAGQIMESLQRMVDVGLGYLSLSRKTDTLSGGEAQRLKLVKHLGSSLTGITYIFDEPTAGLHPADAGRLSRLLENLRDHQNSVLVVEHSRQMMLIADHIIEMGPRAGRHGGEIVYEGDLAGLKEAGTMTALSMKEGLQINRAPLPWQESYAVEHARIHNLKDVTVEIPKGIMTAVTGVAGSGKSSLICCAFTAQHPEAVVVDQRPIGTSIRSTPATYTGVMDRIRKHFAKANGVSAQWFSSNSKGACPACRGRGEISPEVAFADPVTIVCEECGGKRFNPTALSYKYKGKNIEEVMAMTIEEALEFFDDGKILTPLETLVETGLGYMTLGQPSSTLSGGETQRLKLAGELKKSGSIYILDEPATGLHNEDVRRLTELLRRLVSQGNTVVAVEHRPELITACDYIIDMGPGAGSEGGTVVFTGTPEEILSCEASVTGRYLKELMR